MARSGEKWGRIWEREVLKAKCGAGRGGEAELMSQEVKGKVGAEHREGKEGGREESEATPIPLLLLISSAFLVL